MTKARLGFQFPAISKKLRTFAGLIMPEIVMPRPKMAPISKAETSLFIGSASDHVTDDVDCDERRSHEGRDCRQRTRRKPRQSAYAMAARTPIAEMDADAD